MCYDMNTFKMYYLFLTNSSRHMRRRILCVNICKIHNNNIVALTPRLFSMVSSVEFELRTVPVAVFFGQLFLFF